MNTLRVADHSHADKGRFDGGDGLTPSEHNGAIDVTSASIGTISRRKVCRLTFMQRHLIAPNEKHARAVDDAIGRLRGLPSPSPSLTGA